MESKRFSIITGAAVLALNQSGSAPIKQSNEATGATNAGAFLGEIPSAAAQDIPEALSIAFVIRSTKLMVMV